MEYIILRKVREGQKAESGARKSSIADCTSTEGIMEEHMSPVKCELHFEESSQKLAESLAAPLQVHFNMTTDGNDCKSLQVDKRVAETVSSLLERKHQLRKDMKLAVEFGEEEYEIVLTKRLEWLQENIITFPL